MRSRSLALAFAVTVLIAACSAPSPTAIPDRVKMDEVLPRDTTGLGGFGSGHSVSPIEANGITSGGASTSDGDGGFGSGHIIDPGTDSTAVTSGTGGFGSGH